MTLMLLAAWRFNPRIAGLGSWTLSYCSGLLFSLNLLLRAIAPELLLVMLAQLSAFMMVYLNLQATRAYTGAPPLSWRQSAPALVLLLALAAYFTRVQPDEVMRYTLTSLMLGAMFLLAARTIARGGLQHYPARLLYAAICASHGLFLLFRPWLFQLGNHGLFDGSRSIAVSPVVAVESIVGVVLLAFCIVMLANERVTQALRDMADRDPLTGVHNHRAFLALLDKGGHQADRAGAALSVLLLDLDHFKRINDSWGHRVGDEALRHVVAVAQDCIREGDVIGRLGGEEFAIFLPATRQQAAETVARRLRAAVESRPLLYDGHRIVLTASVGVACRHDNEAPAHTLHRADSAMYRAKENGRNRVELAWSLAEGTAAIAQVGQTGS
ncbi:GGDEF domain-containing protein [Vogesella oryzae]|uniref:GGDEF domain-containing protein n=1 Tax=Vogesella oryzae TaxID=1735285 RepID=UPI001C2EB595|nr:GGDEF domain-containing protein [Vogesella oryzae]